MRTLSIVTLAALGSLGSAAPLARVAHNSGALSLVNASSQAEINLWGTGFGTDSLAMDLTGSLYSSDIAGSIYNVTSPVPFLLGATGLGQVGDLDYGNNGLWGYSNSVQSLFFFDFGSNSVSYQTTLTGLAGTVSGVAYQPSSGSVFLSAYTGYNADSLYEVQASSTTAILKGTMSHSDAFSYIADIDFSASGTLFAMTWYHRDFLTVSTVDGSTAAYSSGPHRDVTAMALEPVPEPASLLAVAMGLVALRRRRQV